MDTQLAHSSLNHHPDSCEWSLLPEFVLLSIWVLLESYFNRKGEVQKRLSHFVHNFPFSLDHCISRISGVDDKFLRALNWLELLRSLYIESVAPVFHWPSCKCKDCDVTIFKPLTQFFSLTLQKKKSTTPELLTFPALIRFQCTEKWKDYT